MEYQNVRYICVTVRWWCLGGRATSYCHPQGHAIVVLPGFRRVTSTPDPVTFEEYRDTPPISIGILLQKSALHLVESSIYTANLYHDAAPIRIAILLQKY